MPALELSDYSLESVTPGRCFLTYSPRDQTERVFRVGQIDTERGWVEVGERGIMELAQQIGWIEKTQADRLKEEIRQLKDELAASQELVDSARIEVVTQLGVKVEELGRNLASEKRKTRRYGKQIEDLKKMMAKRK